MMTTPTIRIMTTYSKLHPHQKKAIEELRDGCILCGGVGSGKSRTALGYFVWKSCGFDKRLENPKKPKDLYIITTARKRDTHEWEDECRFFGLSFLPQNSIAGIRVSIDSWNNIKKYANVTDAFFIFDEQRVVGSGTWVKAFLKIAKKNLWILLSATPGDTWTDYIPVFIANGFYKNRSEFIDEHIIYKRFAKYPQIDRYVGTKKLDALRKRLIVEMPFERDTVQHHETIYTNYDIQKYNTIMRRRWNPYADEPIQEVAALCYLLRRVVNEDMDRLHTVQEILSARGSAIIFYNFDYELELLKATLSDAVEVREWNGHKHEKIPLGKRWAYLVQYTAGAEGWNCTQTDTMIFYSQNYSYKTMVQAAGRIDRMNTPYKDLYYYHLRSRAKIDIAIANTLKLKKNFNEKAFIEKRASREKHML